MTGRRIRLNNGVTYEDSTCGYADGFLWCYILNHTLQEVASTFFDTTATSKIVFEYGTMSDTYEGYTFVRFMQSSETGCEICLIKQASAGGNNNGSN